MRRQRFHDLRHGCATQLLARGVDGKTVQGTLGHSQYSLTMDVCGHPMPSTQQDTADEMERLYGEHPTDWEQESIFILNRAKLLEQQATVVDDYLRNEVDEIERVVALPEGDRSVPQAVKKPPVADHNPTEQSPQQSLLLDEPDQNTHVRVPAAEQAGASDDNPEKTA